MAFVAVEGIDGSGKSTLVNQLKEWLPVSGLMPAGAKLIVTRLPGGTEMGLKIREMLIENDLQICKKAQALLFLADALQVTEEVIQPAIAAGDWVLSDRSHFSTVAYQGYGNRQDLGFIENAAPGILPDIVLWLDVEPEEAQRRLRRRSVSDRYEKRGLDFARDVRRGYQIQARKSNWIRLENEPLKAAKKALNDNRDSPDIGFPISC